MKRIIIILVAAFIAVNTFGQAPQKMSYQAVIRDVSNNLITNSIIGMQVSILQDSLNGTPVYVETQSPTSNSNGLVSIQIGSGNVVTGSFATIDWAVGPYFVKTETDPSGGTNYTITGISQLLSVPYALYAKTAENGFSGNYNDLTNTPNNVSSFTNDAGYLTTFTEVDGSVTNELQTISQSGHNVTLSNGGGTISIADGDTSLWKQNGLDIIYAKVGLGGGIGIGTKNPANYLHIQDTTNTGTVAAIIDAKTASSLYLRTFNLGLNKSWVIQNTGTGGSVQDAFNITSFDGTNWTDHVFKIEMGAPNYSFYLNSQGYLGLGTPTPSSKLDVNGDIALSGTLRIGGDVQSTYSTIYDGPIIYESRAAGAPYPFGNTGNLIIQSWAQAERDILFVTGINPLARMSVGSQSSNGTVKVLTSDISIETIGSGVILKSPNGSCWRVTVDNSGNLVRTAVACP